MKDRVIVVTDDPILGNLLEVRLSDAGYEALYASDADAAGILLRDLQRPDVMVITEANLPESPGPRELFRKFEAAAGGPLPVIFMTESRAGADDGYDGLSEQWTDRLAKPFRIETLLGYMERLKIAGGQSASAEPEIRQAAAPENGSAPGGQELPEAESPSGENRAETDPEPMPVTPERTTEKDAEAAVADPPDLLETEAFEPDHPVMAPGLVNLLKSFARRQMSGLLEIRDIPVKGTIYIDEGRIVHAVHGDAAGKKALFRIFREPVAAPLFHPQPVSVASSIREPLERLIRGGEKEAGTLGRLEAASFERVLMVDEDRLAAHPEAKTRSGLAHIVRQIGEGAPMKAVFEGSSLVDHGTYTNLIYLIKKGIVKVQPRTAPGVRIVTDASADLPDAVLEQYPSVCRVSPLNAASSGSAFDHLFADLAQKSDILAILPAEELSPAFRQARAARDLRMESYTERRRARFGRKSHLFLEIVDSRLISLGQGLLVTEAARRLEQGWPPATVRDHIIGLAPAVRLLLAPDSHRRIRDRVPIGGFRAMMADMAGGRPIIAIRKGQPVLMDRVRGEKGVAEGLLRWLEWSLEDLPSRDVLLRIGLIRGPGRGKDPGEDADTDDDMGPADRLSEAIHNRFNCEETIRTRAGSAMTDLFGPNLLGVACLPICANPSESRKNTVRSQKI